MAGLLNTFFGNADQTQALGLLGAAMASGQGFGQGSLLAQQHLAGAPDRRLKQGLLQAQLEETQAQARERQMRAQREEQALELERRKRAALPNIFGGGGLVGGAPAPQMQGDIPMFSQPMGVTPMQPQGGGGLDWRRALAEGYTPEEIVKLSALPDLGRPKATRQMEVDDGNGGKRIALVDDFGNEVAGFAGYTAPVQVNRGDRVDFVKPAPGVSLSMNMSPEARASNALGWANHGLTRRGQDLTDARARETNVAGKIPAGYRIAADGKGLEFIPGGPADPNAAKRAAPTEFQGKSAIYGTRAQESDRIISELDGKYSPAAINAKEGAAKVPLFGGALEAAGNLALSANAQKAEQAQRDFINAVLRQESGAVISEPEFANARKQYFPQPFDSAAVKAQKAANRKLAIQGILNNARGGASEPVQTGQPSVEDLLKKYGGK